MFKIPDTFLSENEEYLTLVPVRKFAIENPDAKIKNTSRLDQLSQIEAYANIDMKKQEIVEEWIDNSVCAGRKEVYIKELEDDRTRFEYLKNEDNVEKLVQKKITEHRHLCQNIYTPEYTICKYRLRQGELGAVLQIIMCKMIYSFDSKEEKSTQWYPVVVNVYLDKRYIEARAKQKTHMFKYEQVKEIDEIPALTSLTPEKEAHEALEYVCSILGIHKIKNFYKSSENIKEKIYNLLERSIGTPEEIKGKLEQNESTIAEITKYYNQTICHLPEVLKSDFQEDIRNIFEKYMAITREDTALFVRDKRMYPVRLIASDEDTSKVDQTSAGKAPLQSKTIFYNNKSMIFKNKKCDGIMFSVEKEENNTKRNRFCVKILEKKGYCVIAWSEYLKEDDINYVLHAVVNA